MTTRVQDSPTPSATPTNSRERLFKPSNGHVPPEKIRRQGIDTFAIAVDICDDKKFFKFKRALRVDQKTAYLCFARFINFVAKNHAFTGQINLQDADVIAEFCWFDGDDQTFIDALQSSGFVHKDGTVNDWFDWQPLAKFIISQRENGQKGGRPKVEKWVNPNPQKEPIGLTQTPQKSNLGKPKRKKKGDWVNPADAGADAGASADVLSTGSSLEGGGEVPPPQPTTRSEAVVQIMNQLGQETGIVEYQQIKLTHWQADLRKYGMKYGFECIHKRAEAFRNWMIGQLQAKKISARATHNPNLRFFNNWLDKTFDSERTSGDYDDIPVTQKPKDLDL